MFSKLQERAVCLSIVKSNMTPTTHLHLLLYPSEGEFHVLLTRTHAHINNTQCISSVARNEFNTHTHCLTDTSLEQAKETKTRWITTIHHSIHTCAHQCSLALFLYLSLYMVHTCERKCEQSENAFALSASRIRAGVPKCMEREWTKIENSCEQNRRTRQAQTRP